MREQFMDYFNLTKTQKSNCRSIFKVVLHNTNFHVIEFFELYH